MVKNWNANQNVQTFKLYSGDCLNEREFTLLRMVSILNLLDDLALPFFNSSALQI